MELEPLYSSTFATTSGSGDGGSSGPGAPDEPPGSGPAGARGRAAREERVDDTVALSFPAAVFSLVFGEGDADPDLRARRWRLVAAMLGRCRFAALDEDFRPFDLRPEAQAWEGSASSLAPTAQNSPPPPPPDGAKSLHPETQAALAHLRGRPACRRRRPPVLVCAFPALAAAAAARGAAGVGLGRGDGADALVEREGIFTRAGPGQQAATAGLAVVNLFLAAAGLPVALALGAASLGPAAAQGGGGLAARGGAVALWILSLCRPWLLVHALLFFLIPAARLPLLRWRNAGVARRNGLRAVAAARLRAAETSVETRDRRHFAEQVAKELEAEVRVGSTPAYATRTEDPEEEVRLFVAAQRSRDL